MRIDRADALRDVRTFPALIKFLRDELDWPIESDDFEELTFDYTPEELGIDSAIAAKIQEIKRLRPMTPNQPWGIFFVKFEPKRLPVVALRRILSRVVVKKRASANSAERAAWQTDDLLFVSNYGEGEERRISFAHFSQEGGSGDLPTLKVLGWDNLDTPLHLDDVAEKLTTNLAWPADEDDVAAWRERWRSAFTLRHLEVITTSRDLSIRLAELARAIRDRIKTTLAIETEHGPLTRLMKAFREALVHDLDADGFADMYAQTIAYGLLSARIADPKSKTSDDFAAHMRTNPFLKELMEAFLHVGGRRGEVGDNGIDFDELGASEVVELLDHAKIEAVLRDFGNRNPLEDPVIHFYELFLKEYDAEKRMQRGVFYTPRPVVSYIVRSVDELLRSELGLADGLADTSTWGMVSYRNAGFPLPEGVSQDQPFIQILDPATGTGTFLVEVIEVIHETMVGNWEGQGYDSEQIATLWNEYVPQHLLPRLHGYELLMAPYAIAHLKIGLKLYETGYRFNSDERARVYLTNALEPADDFTDRLEFAVPALAHETQAVNTIKRSARFTVVIGNPPYSVSSWNTGAWITSLAEDYKRTVRIEESQIQSLSNDYIKFLRFGEWHIEQASLGVLGLITGHGYLHGTQPRDLRAHLCSTFDDAYCLDLHGSVRRAGTGDPDDEPVFQIMTGVAVMVGVRSPRGTRPGVTALTSLTGSLARKFAFLGEETMTRALGDVPKHKPAPPNFYFAASETPAHIADEYEAWPDLPEIFGTGQRQTDKEVAWATGFASQQDELAMSFTLRDVQEKMAALAESSSFAELNLTYRLCSTDQWNYEDAKDFARQGLWRNYVGEVAYRPFDRRWTVLHKNVLTILRRRVMSQLSGPGGTNIGLISSRAVNDLAFAHCFVTREPVDKIFISSKTSTNAYVFPLFLSDDDGLFAESPRPNLSNAFLARLSAAVGLERVGEYGMPQDVPAEHIFQFAYAVLHSPAYRERYGEFLRIDFPRLPLTTNLVLFRRLAELGGELIAVHLLESPTLDQPVTTYVGASNPTVERIGWSNDTVWIDAPATRKGEPSIAGTAGFVGVSVEVWNFHVGGYQVCEKWLKDRKGRTLSIEDTILYQKIIVSLSETLRLMNEVDEVIEKHGGWPAAFAQTP